MKNMKRIISILLASVLMFCLWFPTQATEGEGITLSMTASQSAIEVGESMMLTIGVDQAFSSRGSGMTICYDASVLELDLTASSAAEPFRIDGPITVGGKTVLRISFLPGVDVAEFTAEIPLAQISFKALSVADQTEIFMSAAYLYDELLSDILQIKPNPVSLTVEPSEEYIPVTGITLDKSELTMEEGDSVTLKATIAPAGASDPTVIWTSSNENVATVSNGTVEAVLEGTATITATAKDGGFTASCTVTVKAPQAGYTVKLPEDSKVVLGGTVKLPVTISHEDGKREYNAFDISFTYDPEVLELVTTSIPDMTVKTTSGRINVLSYGDNRSAGSIPFTLEFKTLKLEDTQVQITTARVDNSGNAVIKNTAAASLINDTTTIAVTGYPVTLPDGFTGAESVLPNTEYTFAEPKDYFDYTVAVTVDGVEIKITDNGDGTYTIPAELVTGEIVVTTTKVGKTFKVTLGTDMTGEPAAQHGTDYAATIKRDEAYRYTVTVTIGGKDYTGYAASGNTYTIPGGDITGDIVFTVTKEEIPKPSEPVTMHSVTFSGSGAGAAQGNATSVAHGDTYTLKLKQETGYSYQVSYQMGGKPAVEIFPVGDGTYVIENVTAPLEIIIEKTLNIRVSAHEYVNLDRKTIFLVLVDTKLDDGKVFTYNGNAMYYSETYGAWAYLTVVDGNFSVDMAKEKIAVSEGTRQVMASADCDVNATGLVDINDAQLVYDIYNGKYENFDRINMIKFLNADVNVDKQVSVKDVAAVVAKIK